MATLIRRSNGIYYYITSSNGRRIWKSTGTKRRADALNAIREHTEKAPSTPSAELTLSAFLTQLLKLAATSGSKSNVDSQNRRQGPEEPGSQTPSHGLTLSRFWIQFMEYGKTNYAPGTVALYQGAVKAFQRIIGDKVLHQYSTLHVEQFKNVRSNEVSPVKGNIDFRCLKALFQTAVRWDILTQNPFSKVKQIKVPPSILKEGSR